MFFDQMVSSTIPVIKVIGNVDDTAEAFDQRCNFVLFPLAFHQSAQVGFYQSGQADLMFLRVNFRLLYHFFVQTQRKFLIHEERFTYEFIKITRKSQCGYLACGSRHDQGDWVTR